MKNILAFEVAPFGNVEVLAEETPLAIAKNLKYLLTRPDEELSFLALRICVLARIEPAGGIGHLADHIIECLFGDAPRRVLRQSFALEHERDLRLRLAGTLLDLNALPRDLRVEDLALALR